jgi:hypothetical protein
MMKNILVFHLNQIPRLFFEYVYVLFHHLFVLREMTFIKLEFAFSDIHTEQKVHMHQLSFVMDVQENYLECFFLVEVFQHLIRINHDERN